MRERPELTFSSITERDVDLLLVEELKCSEGFLEWFLTKALGRAQWRERSSFRVRHSVPGVGKHAGETDIEVSFTGGNQGETRDSHLLGPAAKSGATVGDS